MAPEYNYILLDGFFFRLLYFSFHENVKTFSSIFTIFICLTTPGLEYQISFASNPNIREIDQYELDYQQNYQWDTFYLMGRDEQKLYNENNATYKRLYVTPFNTQCLTEIDYCYLVGKPK